MFYKEAEDIDGFTAKTTNNATIRCSAGTGGISTSPVALTTLAAGKYTIFGQVWGTSGLTATLKAVDNTVWELASTGSLVSSTSAEFNLLTSTDLTVVTTGGNDNRMLDLIYIVRTGDATTSVSKTITSAGWATYCSPYALDFSSAIDNLDDAYIVTGGADGVLSKTSVKGSTVPANTGLLLKGEGACTIPVAASSSTDVSTNKLVGKTAEFALAANDGYVLMNDATNGLAFYKNTNAFTVGANTAYLPANFTGSGARGFFLLDGSDATGIGTALMNKEAMNSEVYNLQGQRVAAPTKGLYIVNGKKAIVK